MDGLTKGAAEEVNASNSGKSSESLTLLARGHSWLR